MFRIRLKELRERRGMSQYAFASDFGVAQSTVGSWESGKREPNHTTTQKLADYFEVTVDYLLGREEVRVAISAPNGYASLSEEQKEQINGFIESFRNNSSK